MTYVFKGARGESPVTAELVRVGYQEKVRTKKVREMESLGLAFREVEHAGWDRSKLRIAPGGRGEDGVYVRGRHATGQRMSNGRVAVVANSAAGVKSVLRRVRPEEEAEIAAADERIAALEAALEAARGERAAVVKQAFDRGHVVRLNELNPEERKVYG